jgi:hypothetical protein
MRGRQCRLPGENWSRNCALQLDQALRLPGQFVPVKTVILSSYAPKQVCERITSILSEWIESIEAIAGFLDFPPKAIGAASLPLSSKLMVK